MAPVLHRCQPACRRGRLRVFPGSTRRMDRRRSTKRFEGGIADSANPPMSERLDIGLAFNSMHPDTGTCRLWPCRSRSVFNLQS